MAELGGRGERVGTALRLAVPRGGPAFLPVRTSVRNGASCPGYPDTWAAVTACGLSSQTRHRLLHAGGTGPRPPGSRPRVACPLARDQDPSAGPSARVRCSPGTQGGLPVPWTWEPRHRPGRGQEPRQLPAPGPSAAELKDGGSHGTPRRPAACLLYTAVTVHSARPPLLRGGPARRPGPVLGVRGGSPGSGGSVLALSNKR